MSMRMNATMASLPGEMKACPILTGRSRRAEGRRRRSARNSDHGDWVRLDTSRRRKRGAAAKPFSRLREKVAAQRPDEGM
jgi:hypothetical protein